ncbi:structural maintenance of chromosomes 6 isoform X2 [Xylocopa sonorina]|uniref:structural maintenance of chromosomes 6 isoform X2 n=1 Tax=Xylocopa sonorina TaxID=1818115 RepID=UPI00403AD700
MENNIRYNKKRKSAESTGYQSKRSRDAESDFSFTDKCKAGKITKILIRNFMCHDAFEITLNPNVNFIVGRNGSGKSAILTALTVGLGARAHVTSRGSSLKNFIKKGKNSATIEITLLNKGPMAYRPDVYGEFITVFRSIGNVTSYKLKNWKGDIISTKRNELVNMLKALNIQIDNPISILNQDISRTFLISSKPEEKYELFMKATLLDVIGNNYNQAQLTCQEEYEKLKQYNKIFAETTKEIEQLKINIKKAEEIDKFRNEKDSLEVELLWAIATIEEKKLQKIDENFRKCEDDLKQFQSIASSTESKDGEINKRIQELQEEIKQAKEEVDNDSEAYNKAKQECSISKEKLSIKMQEWRSVQNKIKRLEDDIATLRKEIHRLESGDNAEQSERNQIMQQITDLEQKLEETEALLRTKKTYHMQLEHDKVRLLNEIQSSKIKISSCENRIENIKREIHVRKKYSDNALAVFGQNIPRLLRRIDEGYSSGQFKEKPRGPLGAYIKMKDPAWAPAVENFLGAGTFCTFCVDNSHDAKILNAIMQEIYLNERTPQIICSKFYHAVHDVRSHCASSSSYSNLLNAMEISDPVVANCLIDHREVECVLLIPTSKEAAEVMSNASKVPRNCKRAFTQKGDTFFPDPHYRSYGGPRNLKARFLQVSVTDTINELEEELRTIINDKSTAAELYKTAYEKEKRARSELSSVTTKVSSLLAAQNRYKVCISDLRDKLSAHEAISVTVFKDELSELEEKLRQSKREELHLNENVLELQKAVETLEEQIKQHRQLQYNLNSKIFPLEESIKELENEKEALHAKSRHAVKKSEALLQALQNATATLERQKRCTEKAVSDAESRCERINTERSVSELERLYSDIKRKICEIEQQFGRVDEFRRELKQKEAKYGKDLHLISKIERSYQLHLKRLELRKQSFFEMKVKFAENIQNSFANVLTLRNKKYKN